MKSKYSIGILIFTFIFIYISSNSIYSNNSQNIKTKDTLSTEGHALNLKGYYLYEVNGLITVYYSDKKTIYEYTNIKSEDLPPLLQSEIENGKYIENLEELYGFLENYTS